MNILEKHAEELMRRDPLAEAEKILGQEGQLAHSLGFVLLQDIQRQKEDALDILGDTHFNTSYAALCEHLLRNGFDPVYIETHGDRGDVYQIWWHTDGLLLTSESYERTRVNATQVYYNWVPGERKLAWELR